MNIKLVNFTPHDLNIKLANGEFLTLPPSGKVLRAPQTEKTLWGKAYSGVNIWSSYVKQILSNNESLRDILEFLFSGSEAEEAHFCFGVVSRMAKEALPESEKGSFLCPGELIRDEKGNPIGCDGLSL